MTHPKAIGWANELLTIWKEQFGWVDRQVTQCLIQELHNMEMLPSEHGNMKMLLSEDGA